MEWDGNESPSGLKIWPTEELSESQKHFLPTSHFGSGVVTFHVEFMFWTEAKIAILTKGPANMPKHGIQPLEGVVETDWLPYPFTMNWRMTAKNQRVRFERGEPICQVIPWPMGLIESCECEIVSLHTNPELYLRYEDYRKKRGMFNKKFEHDGKKRQKYYVRGDRFDGEQVHTRSQDRLENPSVYQQDRADGRAQPPRDAGVVKRVKEFGSD